MHAMPFFDEEEGLEPEPELPEDEFGEEQDPQETEEGEETLEELDIDERGHVRTGRRRSRFDEPWGDEGDENYD
jgi:hypothetical protein